jgi:hypothetical protein
MPIKQRAIKGFRVGCASLTGIENQSKMIDGQLEPILIIVLTEQPQRVD